MQRMITNDLDALLEVLPLHVRQTLWQQEDVSSLLEVVMDLGRPPDARFPDREVVLSPNETTEADIDYISSRISVFGDDNRAGIARTLHRISAIRNRQGRIVGLTLRVGRAVYGTMRIIEDLVETGKSILLLGRPGVGKTTMLREVARVLADDFKKRVIIVDTSNEIAGDGDIPHPAIGHARRMQVVTPSLQHAVMIEAVENHMPEVIVIDEIGTELEAKAARSIAERGVQLVGTAHGNTLENLIMNPTLSDLIGGIQTVTLGDEEAKRRGTQKSILERMAPPTFDIVVEIQSWERVAIHPDVTSAVDSLLRGQLLTTEVRWLDESGEVKTERVEPEKHGREVEMVEHPRIADGNRVHKLFLYGINRSKILEVARDMQVKLDVVESLKHASILVTTKQYYRRKPRSVREAEVANLPVYVLKSNSPAQIRQFLNGLYPVSADAYAGKQEAISQALGEAEEAVNRIRDGEGEVELGPRSAYIRRLQHLIAEKYDLASRSLGREPNRRVLIYK